VKPWRRINAAPCRCDESLLAADGKAAAVGDEALTPRCVTSRRFPPKTPVLPAPPLALLCVGSESGAPVAKTSSAGPKTT
jgi:hypothetical protein